MAWYCKACEKIVDGASSRCPYCFAPSEKACPASATREDVGTEVSTEVFQRKVRPASAPAGAGEATGLTPAVQGTFEFTGFGFIHKPLPIAGAGELRVEEGGLTLSGSRVKGAPGMAAVLVMLAVVGIGVPVLAVGFKLELTVAAAVASGIGGALAGAILYKRHDDSASRVRRSFPWNQVLEAGSTATGCASLLVHTPNGKQVVQFRPRGDLSNLLASIRRFRGR